jgi:hypothetical protein
MSCAASFHESGHCLLAYLCGRSIRGVRLDPGGEGAVTCQVLSLAAQYRMPAPVWRRRAIEEAKICFAGPLAELAATGDYDASACSVDLESGHRWIRQSAADTASCFRDTIDLLRSYWPAVLALAARLQAAGSLDGRQVVSTIARASARREV